jgi:hypothetical protein
MLAVLILLGMLNAVCRQWGYPVVTDVAAVAFSTVEVTMVANLFELMGWPLPAPISKLVRAISRQAGESIDAVTKKKEPPEA